MKVNLEKELIRQNRKIAAPAELLLINEYDRLGSEIADDAVLNRIGLNSAVKEGQKLKERFGNLEQQTRKFNPERVFHISQIEALCHKYYLRFLPASRFRGAIDNKLPGQIAQVEIAYKIECDQANTFIVAPASSFKLEQRPKDPLLFYRINDEYYYLIHKWGNDLNIFRRILPMFTYKTVSILTVLVVGFLLGAPLFFWVGGEGGQVSGGIFWGLAAVVSFIMTTESKAAFLDRDSWDSEIE